MFSLHVETPPSNDIMMAKNEKLSSPKRFDGKVAIITASNCGIDQAIAVLLGTEGAKVSIHGTEEEELRMTVDQLIHAGVPGDNIYVVQGAIDKEETLNNLISRTVAKFGRLDLLINNTGGIPQQTLNTLNKAHAANNTSPEKHDGDANSNSNSNNNGTNNTSFRHHAPHRRLMRLLTPSTPMFTISTASTDSNNNNNGNNTNETLAAAIADFDYMFNTNMKSITTLTRLAIPHLEETKGAVVNVSCFGGQKAFSDYVHYAHTKQALDSYCRNAAIKYVKRGVRINNVNPGFITGLTLEDNARDVNKFDYNWIKNHVPMGRGGTAEEVAKVIAFLASDDASYITGQCIVVDGGAALTNQQGESNAAGGSGLESPGVGSMPMLGSLSRRASVFGAI